MEAALLEELGELSFLVLEHCPVRHGHRMNLQFGHGIGTSEGQSSINEKTCDCKYIPNTVSNYSALRNARRVG